MAVERRVVVLREEVKGVAVKLVETQCVAHSLSSLCQ